VTIWDDTARSRFFTKQQQPLQFGDAIEAIGEADGQGYDKPCKRLVSNHQPAGDRPNSCRQSLDLADQVRG